uniref:Uncharacterized protein n=1 Tax=Romanomermis culicivorax TaxID=13658 RepID=A0A915JVX0_ROMCU
FVANVIKHTKKRLATNHSVLEAVSVFIPKQLMATFTGDERLDYGHDHIRMLIDHYKNLNSDRQDAAAEWEEYKFCSFLQSKITGTFEHEITQNAGSTQPECPTIQ